MTDYTTTYGPAFVSQITSEAHRTLMLAMADALQSELHPEMVLDVGGGDGTMLRHFLSMGAGGHGTEHPESTFSRPPHLLIPVDLETWTLPFQPRFYDLVVCIEVAEHLTPARGPILIEELCRASNGSVWFSAAYPGQGGTGHVNERPMVYWSQRFAEHGFLPHGEATERILDAYAAAIGNEWWYRRAVLYRRTA